MMNPVFELFAVLGLDTKKFDNDLSESGGKLKSFGSTIAKGLKTAAKVGGAAIAASAAGLAALGKQAVESYADYEQLVGGVDTLFKRSEQTFEEYAASALAAGKGYYEAAEEYRQMNAGAETVMKNAAQAFETAGLSANEYMETVTSFSAALVSSLGGDTKAAADLADMAIRDMSDNANKMGSDMSSIQAAYQGFAKQNYTMLDNLNNMGALAA